jgi:hypothetical protein
LAGALGRDEVCFAKFRNAISQCIVCDLTEASGWSHGSERFWEDLGEDAGAISERADLSRATTSCVPSKMPAPPEFIQFIDNNADAFIKRLSDAVAIPRCVRCLDETASC